MEDRLDNNHFYNTIWKYKICQTSLSFGEGWGEAKNGLFYISKWYNAFYSLGITIINKVVQPSV